MQGRRVRSAPLQPPALIKRALRRPYHLARGGARLALVPYRLTRARRLELCCCGLSKSGTHSMAGMFEGYRSAHHPDERYRLRLATAYLRGDVDAGAAERALRRRDRLLWLEVESSTLAGILVEPLARAFPSRQFILTLRDVYSWTDSWFDHNINFPADAASPWALLERTRLRPETAEPTPHDAPLTRHGFPPLQCFFRLWAAHNAHVLDTVDGERLLVVRTNEITERIPEIAAWAGVPVESLRPERSRLFGAPQKHRLLFELDASYVRETAERLCSELMEAYFPEVSFSPAV